MGLNMKQNHQVPKAGSWPGYVGRGKGDIGKQS